MLLRTPRLFYSNRRPSQSSTCPTAASYKIPRLNFRETCMYKGSGVAITLPRNFQVTTYRRFAVFIELVVLSQNPIELGFPHVRVAGQQPYAS